MRRIIVVLLMLELMSVTCFGAVSEDMNVYVRKDVFEAKMESFMSEIRLMNEQLRSDIRRLETRIDGIEARMGDLRNDIYLGFVLLGIIIAWPKARDMLQKLGKSAPSITLEDVQRLIEQNNAELRKSLQL